MIRGTIKVWLGIGIVGLAPIGGLWHPGGASFGAAPVWAQEGGEGGEGGEAGGVPSSYALQSSEPNAFAYDASAPIAAYAAHVHASYRDAAEAADRLLRAIDAMLAAPSAESLRAARRAWLDARPAYLRTEVFRFYDGPIEAIEGRINAWPINEAFIDYVQGAPQAGLVNDSSVPVSLEAINERDQVSDEADVTTGWHAIEFLLWGQDLSATGPGDRPFTDYVPGRDHNDRRRAYLRLVTQQLVDDLRSLALAWAPGAADNAAARFLALPPREALGRILNGMAILAGYELLSERLAVALDSGDQEDEHSCFSDNTKADFVHNLEGIRLIWRGGAAGAGLASLVSGLDPELAALVDERFEAATAAVDRLGDPWDQVLAAAPDSPPRQDAEAAVSALAELTQALKQVGSRLGVLVLVPSAA